MHQKRVSDLITDGYELPCGCWALNSGPSEEQSELLPSEPSHQPKTRFFSGRFMGFLLQVSDAGTEMFTREQLEAGPSLPLLLGDCVGVALSAEG